MYNRQMDVIRNANLTVDDLPPLKWVGDVPRVYRVLAIKNSDKTKTLIILSDIFGGDICYGEVDGDYAMEGEVDPFVDENRQYIKSKNPRLLNLIEQEYEKKTPSR
jgi:hypothetical protein